MRFEGKCQASFLSFLKDRAVVRVVVRNSAKGDLRTRTRLYRQDGVK
jgi:hypothetical protein